MIVFLEAPSQEPFEESHLFTDGTVSHVFFVTQEIDILVQSELIEIFKGHIFLELLEVIFNGCKLFVCGFSPVILIAAFFYKFIEHLPKTYLCFFLLFFVGILHPQVECIL